MTGPNIIYILADDMGYGDMGCNNPESRIPTPNLDRLAARGMRFTDAHAGSAVCTPSRYSIMTGDYPWRSRLKSGIVWQWDGALIEPGTPTVATLLNGAGYRTACVGKWHLGWDWATHDGQHPNENLGFGKFDLASRGAYAANIDFTARIAGGPVDHGFDSYFGIDVPNFPPYAWFRDDRLTEQPTAEKPDDMFGAPGPAVPDWSLEAMLPEFARRTNALIEECASTGTDDKPPLLLYYPLTSPHTPIAVNKEFEGSSGIGRYGDFVVETDWIVGQVIDAVERAGATDNTLIIFTSDNGPEGHTSEDEGAYERVETSGHHSMGEFRGIKRDAWEGGHRVPFVASWPGTVPEGTTCDQLVCLTDLMATCADLVDAEIPDGAGRDSVSMLPLLTGTTDVATRTEVIHQAMNGTLALRQDGWVFIDAPSGNSNANEPAAFMQRRGYHPHDLPGELFDLDADRPQATNRYGDMTDRVAAMSTRLHELSGDAGR